MLWADQRTETLLAELEQTTTKRGLKPVAALASLLTPARLPTMRRS